MDVVQLSRLQYIAFYQWKDYQRKSYKELNQSNFIFDILRELILALREKKTNFIYDDLMNPKQGAKILLRVTVLVKS